MNHVHDVAAENTVNQIPHAAAENQERGENAYRMLNQPQGQRRGHRDDDTSRDDNQRPAHTGKERPRHAVIMHAVQFQQVSE